MALIDAAQYPAVRAALDKSITENELPDTHIQQPIFLPAAEAVVLALVPDAASRTGDDLARIKRAEST